MPNFGPPDLEPDAETEASAAPPVFTIFGFASRPEVHKLNRNQIYFFVNRRLVRDRLVLHALTEAYRNILPAGVFPVALIFLDLPSSEVDVNVHPSKAEVRFRNGNFVHDLVRDSALQALKSARPIAAFPLPKQAPAAEASPVPPAEQGSGSYLRRQPGPAHPAEAGRFQLSAPRPQPSTEYLPLAEAALSTYAPPPPESWSVPCPTATAAESQRGELPTDLQPLGQIQSSFIVATNPEGLWIIDQHVAHERVLFERHLRRRQSSKVEGQRLLLPIVVDLGPEQRVTFQNVAEELAANGFEVEPFGQGSIAVKAAPADIGADHVEKLVREILETLGQEARGLSLDELRRRIAASVACHAAIKINMPLDQEKMGWLLAELSKTDCPMTCPHGRPVVLRYDMKEIQKAFKRI
jgi:DNA mismatch repair protein MutL